MCLNLAIPKRKNETTVENNGHAIRQVNTSWIPAASCCPGHDATEERNVATGRATEPAYRCGTLNKTSHSAVWRYNKQHTYSMWWNTWVSSMKFDPTTFNRFIHYIDVQAFYYILPSTDINQSLFHLLLFNFFHRFSLYLLLLFRLSKPHSCFASFSLFLSVYFLTLLSLFFLRLWSLLSSSTYFKLGCFLHVILIFLLLCSSPLVNLPAFMPIHCAFDLVLQIFKYKPHKIRALRIQFLNISGICI